jgi:hypothetical protein
MCNHKAIYSGGFKKKVQQIDDNPNIFEVTYKGGRSCCIKFTTTKNKEYLKLKGYDSNHYASIINFIF